MSEASKANDAVDTEEVQSHPDVSNGNDIKEAPASPNSSSAATRSQPQPEPHSLPPINTMNMTSTICKDKEKISDMGGEDDTNNHNFTSSSNNNNSKQNIRVTRSDPLATTSERSHSIRGTGTSGGSCRHSHSHSGQSHNKQLNYESRERRARWIRDKMNNYRQQQQKHQQLAQGNQITNHGGTGSRDGESNYNSNIHGMELEGVVAPPATAFYPHHHPHHPFNQHHFSDSGDRISSGKNYNIGNANAGKILNRPFGRPRHKRPLASIDSSGLCHFTSPGMEQSGGNSDSAGAASGNWISENESKSSKFHRPYSSREQRSWAHPSITSVPLESLEEGSGRQSLRAGLSLPVSVEDGRYFEFKEGNLQRCSGSYHNYPLEGVKVAGAGVGAGVGGDDEEEIDIRHNNFHLGEEEDDEEGEEENKIGDLSASPYHFSRQGRAPYPHCLKGHHNNLSRSGGVRVRKGSDGIGEVRRRNIRSRSQSPCSITSESAESQGEKALDPPRLSIPSEDSVPGGSVQTVIHGGSRGRKLSVLFASYDAWNEDNIMQSFKELSPTTTSIFEAAFTGDLNLLEDLLQDGNEENLDMLRKDEFKDSEGRSPLLLASACGHVSCVKLLLSKGAEVNSVDGSGATALACSASCGSVEVMKVLLEHGANVNSGYEQGRTALFWSIQAGSVDCAKLLLESGAKQNPPQVYSETPLHVAASMADHVCLQLLLDHGADVNLCKGSNRSTALHLAAEEGSSACIRLLLKYGASHSAKDIRGHTALHVAATSDADCVISLLKNGADANAVDANGRTPLHSSIARGSRAAECVRLLVESGADIDAQDNYGYSPLHLCAVNESSQCAAILLHAGSDVTLKNNAGTNALSLLVRRIPDVMRYLIERLDSAVTIHDHDPSDPDCEIRLDFRAIVPNCERRVHKNVGNGYIKGNAVGAAEDGGGGNAKDKIKEFFHKPHKETEFLTCLVAAGNKKILAHPLSEAFLTLKWRRVRKFFWASLLFQIALVALFTMYVVEVYLIHCPYRKHDPGKPLGRQMEPYVQDGTLWQGPIPPSAPPNASSIDSNETDSTSSLPSSLTVDGDIINGHNISRRSAKANPDPQPGFEWFNFRPHKPNKPSTTTTQAPPSTPTTTKRTRGRGGLPVYRFPNGSIIGSTTPPLTMSQSPDKEDLTDKIDTRTAPVHCKLPSYIHVVWLLLLVFTSVLALKEVFQLLQSPVSYVISSENWGQWLLISSVMMTAYSSPQNYLEYWQYPAAACGIFLAWGLMLLQVGRFPALGLYVQMLGKVAANFGLFILAYACLLIAFALAFCVLFPEYPTYSSPPLSILKVFTMMVGEVDYENLFYGQEGEDDHILFPITGHLLYMAFVVIVTIVLMNLLVGLAVHDIQGIQKGAKLNRLSRQTALISRLESFIFSKKLQALLPRTLGSILQKSALLVPSSYNWSYYFRPNDPRDKRLPKDIKLASLRLAASRHSSSKSKSHHHHHPHVYNQGYHYSGGMGAADLQGVANRPISSVSQHHQPVHKSSSNTHQRLSQNPDATIRRMEQRLDAIQGQIEKLFGGMSRRMDAVLEVLSEQKPELNLVLDRGNSEIENDNGFMDDGIFLTKSPSVSPSLASGIYKKPTLSTSSSVLKDVSCEKG